MKHFPQKLKGRTMLQRFCLGQIRCIDLFCCYCSCSGLCFFGVVVTICFFGSFPWFIGFYIGLEWFLLYRLGIWDGRQMRIGHEHDEFVM